MVTKAVGNLLTIAIVTKNYLPLDNGAPTFYSQNRHFEWNVAKKSHRRSLVSFFHFYPIQWQRVKRLHSFSPELIHFIVDSVKRQILRKRRKATGTFHSFLRRMRKHAERKKSRILSQYRNFLPVIMLHNYFNVAKYTRIRHHSPYCSKKICYHNSSQSAQSSGTTITINKTPIDPPKLHWSISRAKHHFVSLSKTLFSSNRGSTTSHSQ